MLYVDLLMVNFAFACSNWFYSYFVFLYKNKKIFFNVRVPRILLLQQGKTYEQNELKNLKALLDLCSNSAPFFYFILKSIFLEDKTFNKKPNYALQIPIK